MSENHFPRILFLTVNGWNDTTGTGTITSIIKNYPIPSYKKLQAKFVILFAGMKKNTGLGIAI